MRTRKKKIEWLQKAYKDPYGVLFATIQIKEYEENMKQEEKLQQ